MARKASKIFIVNGIKNLLIRNYATDPSTIDLESEIDGTLTFKENLDIILEKLNAEKPPFYPSQCSKCSRNMKFDFIYCPYCAIKIEF